MLYQKTRTGSRFLVYALTLIGVSVWVPPASAKGRITRVTAKRLYTAALRNTGLVKLKQITRRVPSIRTRGALNDWAEYRSAMDRDPSVVRLSPRKWKGLTPTERSVIKGTFAIYTTGRGGAPYISVVHRKTGKVILSGEPTARFGLVWQHGPHTMGFQ